MSDSFAASPGGHATAPGVVTLAPEDPLSDVAQACRDAYFAELARLFDGGFDPAAGGSAREASMRPPEGGFLVAWRDGQAVGCGGFCCFGDGIAEVKRMWVSAEARGAGIARSLLREVEAQARAAGYAIARLDTHRVLASAQNLYRREGYLAIPRYNDNPYADFFFEKRLTP